MGTGSRAVAFALVVTLMAAGVFLTRPVIPSQPYRPWQWLAPRSAAIPAMYRTPDDVNWAIRLVIAAALAREFVVAAQRLAAESLYRTVRDWWDSVGGARAGAKGNRP